MPDDPEAAGTGALFKNDRKEKPSHADYRGDITIGEPHVFDQRLDQDIRADGPKVPEPRLA
jgi:hypothetical protein